MVPATHFARKGSVVNNDTLSPGTTKDEEEVDALKKDTCTNEDVIQEHVLLSADLNENKVAHEKVDAVIPA